MEIRERGAEVHVDVRVDVGGDLEPAAEARAAARHELAHAADDGRVAADDVDRPESISCAERAMAGEGLAEPDQHPVRRRSSATSGARLSENGSST